MIIYNGSILKVSGSTLDTEPAPTPMPMSDGTIRFRFHSENIPYDQVASLSRYGKWSQVYDIDTDEPIPGLFDFAPDLNRNYIESMPAGALTEARCGGKVDIVDINISNATNLFFQGAFSSDTALDYVNIENLTASVSCLRMFSESGVSHVRVNLDSATTTENAFDSCTHLATAYITTGSGFDTGCFAGCTGLTDVTIEIESSGYFLCQNGVSDLGGGEILRSITFIATEYSTYRLHNGTGSDQEAFKNCVNLREINMYERSVSSSEPLTRVPLPIGSVGNYAFWNCTGLTAMPYLDVSHVTTANSMFSGCVNMGSGIYDMYMALSGHISSAGSHSHTFSECGSNSESGAAELALIPSSWK